ncbi:uncharacterized protein I206_106034 [Kwoniella pini CBS 10737]|uniref:Uncharacterized protein n=1 Tax=Kwoniella pini CBS 10737 TaxID=1296096 RepID=A0A1B9I0V9_9TREE|nr:uncharacterized protein I206_04857 [Kwoniella pini CBS 10737]OCF49169.1 hypothetical protein I206_04857 [Kwoniella pini CBS 10737]
MTSESSITRTSLLDLDDNLLLLIVSFILGDSDIPLPSFRPHISEPIDLGNPGVKTHYLSLKSTCRRLYHLVPYRLLHVPLCSWPDLKWWDEECPENVLRGIRRVMIDIEDFESESESEILSCQTAKLASSTKINIIIYNYVVSFLNKLTNLEELFIGSLPFTVNFDHMEDDDWRKPSCYPLFPALKSIAFEPRLSDYLPKVFKSFIAAASHLRHLKVPGIFTVCNDSIVWHTRPRGLRQDDFAELPYLETLHLRVHQRDRIRVLSNITKGYPKVSSLNITPCKWMGFSAEPSIRLGARQTDAYSDEWIFKEIRERDINLGGTMSISAADMEDWRADDDWTAFLDPLSQFRYLEDFDCIIELVVAYVSDYQRETDWYSFGRYHTNNKWKEKNPRLRTGCKDSKIQLFSAMRAAARIISEKCSSLRRGYFWQWSHEDTEEMSERTVERWCWTKEESGEIKIVPWSEEIPYEMTLKCGRDLLRTWKGD